MPPTKARKARILPFIIRRLRLKPEGRDTIKALSKEVKSTLFERGSMTLSQVRNLVANEVDLGNELGLLNVQDDVIIISPHCPMTRNEGLRNEPGASNACLPNCPDSNQKDLQPRYSKLYCPLRDEIRNHYNNGHVECFYPNLQKKQSEPKTIKSKQTLKAPSRPLLKKQKAARPQLKKSRPVRPRLKLNSRNKRRLNRRRMPIRRRTGRRPVPRCRRRS